MNDKGEQLHEKLLATWTKDGLVVGTDRFFLIGDRVLDNWERDDGTEPQMQRPTVDFLFADRLGYVWGLALTQPQVLPMAARDVLCRLSVAAARLNSAICDANLQRVFEQTHGGGDLRRAHQGFHDLAEPVPAFAWDKTIHRLLAGPDLDVHVQDQLPLFQGVSLRDLLSRSRELGYAHAGEFKQLETFENSAQWLVGAQGELRAVNLSAADAVGQWLSEPWRVGRLKRISRPFDTPEPFGAYTLISRIRVDENTYMMRAVANETHPLAGREFVITLLHEHLAEQPEAVAAFRASAESAYETGENGGCPFRVEGPL